MKEPNNEEARRAWLASQLGSFPDNLTILDVGAGECQYKPLCEHLRYTAQDVAEYDGGGNQRGLHTGDWDFSQIDIRCDILDIPEDTQYDIVLCTEVLEHVPDPVASLKKLARLVADGGYMVVTAPFISATHFAPYHFATGFSEYFYRHHLPEAGFEIEVLEPNGGYFDFMAQELIRARGMSRKYVGQEAGVVPSLMFKLARYLMKKMARLDGPRGNRNSSEFLTFGWHVRARKISKPETVRD
ncbi:MAG: class I SAM-dependent methyltransferase [Hoeflea sp.]|uniref:class I SAM-dependent methyltransferase n=1 Tax=Hoeflea sp. TaxID=1940281 RepID=UPI0032982927